MEKDTLGALIIFFGAAAAIAGVFALAFIVFRVSGIMLVFEFFALLFALFATLALGVLIVKVIMKDDYDSIKEEPVDINNI